jgi:hypothetical protein
MAIPLAASVLISVVTNTGARRRADDGVSVHFIRQNYIGTKPVPAVLTHD